MVALDEKGRSSFQLLQDIAQEKAPIVYYAFDLLRLKGKNLQALPIEQRKAQLEELLEKPPGTIRPDRDSQESYEPHSLDPPECSPPQPAPYL